MLLNQIMTRNGNLQSSTKADKAVLARRFFAFLALRGHSTIMLAALFCTLSIKFYIASTLGRLSEYPHLILTDIAVLLSIELLLTLACFLWPRKAVMRTVLFIAAVVCTWSVINAGWLIATGTQVLPAVILPLLRDPLNSLAIVGCHLMIRPVTSAILLLPSAVALAFFFAVLAKPPLPARRGKVFRIKAVICSALIVIAFLAHNSTTKHKSIELTSRGLRYNCQAKAVKCLFSAKANRTAKIHLITATRKMPAFDEIEIPTRPAKASPTFNVVVIILEGIQYKMTSLYESGPDLTPKLAALAQQGVVFSNARPTVAHTTKALFSLLTGRYPSISQDIVEAVPVGKAYANLATIFKKTADYRTAFFQSAKGNFECRPGLVYNLGFDKFWAREDLDDPNRYLGYLACDEFAMLEPIADWIKTEDRPFFLTVLCSVTHDPYEVPEAFGPVAKEPLQRYRQAIAYTDRFIAAFDTMLENLHLTENTILCIIGDHGEAFGEHDLFGHARIAFEEALRVVWVIRAWALIQPGLRVCRAVSTVDLPATLLNLLGFDISGLELDGINALGPLPQQRKLYFSCWIPQGPAGFIQDRYKYVYDPTLEMGFYYDLTEDPNEVTRKPLEARQADKIAESVRQWRRKSIFNPNQPPLGRKLLFNRWFCRWNHRKASASYTDDSPNKP